MPKTYYPDVDLVPDVSVAFFIAEDLDEGPNERSVRPVAASFSCRANATSSHNALFSFFLCSHKCVI